MKKFNPQDWQKDPQNIDTENVQYWTKSGIMLTAQMKRKEAQGLVTKGRAFVISSQAIGEME